jgi:hypothetical protein
MSDEGRDVERREHPRMDTDLPARVTAEGRTVDAGTVNLSEGGILLHGADLPSAARVRVEIELAELGWHAVDAEVVRRERAPDGSGDELAARFARAATEGGREAIRAFFEARLRRPLGRVD